MDNTLITRKDLYHLLHKLSHDRVPDRSPLADLLLIRRSLEEAGLSVTDQSRLLELGRLVFEVTEQELARQRRELGLQHSTADGVRRSRIVDDFSRGNRELEAWSAIYHVYLRPDLDLGLGAFTALVGHSHKRTVQRRLSRGVDALTARLQEMERKAESEAQSSRLAARLPATTTTGLIGADAIVNRAIPILCSGDGPAILALGGPAGIGKTEIAAHLARHAVQSRVFSDALWMSARDSDVCNAFSRAAIVEAVGKRLGHSGADLREVLARRARLVVVDGLDDPLLALISSTALADVRWPSKVLLTGRSDWSAIAHVHRLDVPALERPAALALLRRQAAMTGLDEIARAREGTLHPVVAATAGHPLAIRLAVSMLHVMDIRRVIADFVSARGAPADLYRDMWESAWERASSGVRSLVLAAIEEDGELGSRRAPVVSEPHSGGDRASSQWLREAVSSGLLVPDGTASRRAYRPGLFLARYLLEIGFVPPKRPRADLNELSAA